MAKRKRSVDEIPQNRLQLKKVTPLTEAQQMVFDAYNEGMNLFLYGKAGTGKTFLALYLALRDVLRNNSPYKKVIVVRSAVPSRDIGFLPGTNEEKMSVYAAPYIGMLNEIFNRGDGYSLAKHHNWFDMVPTSFLRGMTLHDSIVIADEAQNYNFQELDTLTTRLGTNTRMLVCCDINQNDLLKSRADCTGLPQYSRIVTRMDSFRQIEFQLEDIVRSGFVKEYLLAKDAVERQGPTV